MSVYYHSLRKKRYKVHVKHQPECLDLVLKVIAGHEPDFIIELGTMKGGVTLAINECFPEIPIFSFDKNQKRSRRYTYGAAPICNDKAHFISANLFTPGGALKVKHLLDSKERKLIYCDNGNKLYEVQTFAPYLESGDVIGVHDWLGRPRPEDRSKEYQKKLIKENGALVDTCITEDEGILSYLSELGFIKYHWEWMEEYPPIPFKDDKKVLITDPRASCRFWIRE